MGNITVTIPEERYNELLDIEKCLLEKKVFVVRGFSSNYPTFIRFTYFTKYYNLDEISKELESEKNKLEEERKKVRCMSFREFRKWRNQ